MNKYVLEQRGGHFLNLVGGHPFVALGGDSHNERIPTGENADGVGAKDFDLGARVETLSAGWGTWRMKAGSLDTAATLRSW